MAISYTSPVVGAAVSGFTSPTYTLTTDTAPNSNGKQYAVTSLGGTQAGVDTHTVSKPFTMSFFRPLNIRALPPVNPVTGVIKNIPMNTYKHITRKGVVPAPNQAPMTMRITTVYEIPAGADTYDVANVKAAISAHHGVNWAETQDHVDAALTGII